jgi:cobalt-precorrin-5B (C1)-methyltransferase
VSCTVIKDAGDDPDVTNRAEIGSKVWFTDDLGNISITGGKGVGTITRPGMELPPGEPAINPGPRQMICEAINDVRNQEGIKKGVHVEIFVPYGEEIAKKTLNARLGILGGISILGTTGVVTPMSHEAYIATIEAGISVAKATGIDTVVLTTGRRSERHAMGFLPDMAEEAYVQIGDYFSRSMAIAVEKGLRQVILAAFFGKAVKMAQGAGHTHARTSRLSLAHLAGVASGAGCDGAAIANANTAREAFL